MWGGCYDDGGLSQYSVWFFNCSYRVVLVKCVGIHDVSFDWPMRERGREGGREREGVAP